LDVEEDSLLPAAITSGLNTRLIGRRVIYRPELASTMELARAEAGEGAPEGTVVIAGKQTNGKGRLDRTWLSPAGGIYFSIILYPDISHLHSLIMVASLAVVYAISEVTGLQTQIKWPNDVLVRTKKLCGILIESGAGEGNITYAVVGIGINANIQMASFAEISPVATSLSDELGRDVSRLELVRKLLSEFERLYLSLPGETIYQEWRNSLLTLGRKVHARSGNSVYEGVAESVARDGSLILRRSDGSLISVSAGDVTLRS
jgi:BirA family biotin operon repressor/biotin-[acetyl-CoA-carboxylase] ligase